MYKLVNITWVDTNDRHSGTNIVHSIMSSYGIFKNDVGYKRDNFRPILLCTCLALLSCKACLIEWLLM